MSGRRSEPHGVHRKFRFHDRDNGRQEFSAEEHRYMHLNAALTDMAEGLKHVQVLIRHHDDTANVKKSVLLKMQSSILEQMTILSEIVESMENG